MLQFQWYGTKSRGSLPALQKQKYECECIVCYFMQAWSECLRNGAETHNGIFKDELITDKILYKYEQRLTKKYLQPRV